MSTFLQLLRIWFWMLPLQRWLTVIGGLVMVTGLVAGLPFNAPGSTLPGTFFGLALMVAVPLLAGGVFFRQLSASRALMLRPRARGRLLGGAIGILLLASFLTSLAYWAALLPVPLPRRPGAEVHLLMFAQTVSFGTQCAITLFIASRSPVWTLAILLAWQLPALAMRAFGVEDAARLLGGQVSLVVTALAWVAFACWYLRARRVHASIWGRTAAAESAAEQAVRPASREQAMSRWVLGGATPLRIGMYCLLAGLAVIALQWFLARDSGERMLHAMMFGLLGLTGAVSGMLGSAMAARSRSLWLPAGRTRLQLHGWMERQLLRVVLAVSLALLLAAALVWWLVTPRPALPAPYLAAAVLAPGLAAAWLGLMQQHRHGLFDALAGLAILAGWFHGLVQPLYQDSAAPRWWVLAAQLALAVLLREVALVRWRSADWRRAQRA